MEMLRTFWEGKGCEAVTVLCCVGCTAQATFRGRGSDVAIHKAKVAGWSVSPDGDLCPKCNEVKS